MLHFKKVLKSSDFYRARLRCRRTELFIIPSHHVLDGTDLATAEQNATVLPPCFFLLTCEGMISFCRHENEVHMPYMLLIT